MNRFYVRVGAVALLLCLFAPLPVFAASFPATLSISVVDETNTSMSSSSSSSASDNDEKTSKLELILEILGSGVVCGSMTRILDRYREKKLRLLSAADAMLAAFNTTFSDSFLKRDDNDCSMFRNDYHHFCKRQSSLIELLKKNKHGEIFISHLAIDYLVEEIKNVSGDVHQKEDAVREYIGKEHSKLTAKLTGIR